jgi:hypothetical protein
LNRGVIPAKPPTGAAAGRRRHRIPERFSIHGHAIVSADDFIAGADGLTPPELRNEADWQRFQAMLDASVVTVLGRLGHEANPNTARRRRLVLTMRVDGLEQAQDGWFWNPNGVLLGTALEAILPRVTHRAGGVLAVPGGQPVFDFFLALGYDEFHLARAERVTIGEGTKLFSHIGADRTAVDALRASGMSPGSAETLDAAAGVSLTVWCRSDDAS